MSISNNKLEVQKAKVPTERKESNGSDEVDSHGKRN